MPVTHHDHILVTPGSSSALVIDPALELRRIPKMAALSVRAPCCLSGGMNGTGTGQSSGRLQGEGSSSGYMVIRLQHHYLRFPMR